MRQFAVARSRLKRAEAHFELAAAQWNGLEDLYSIDLTIDPDGNGRIRVSRNNPIPDDISLLLGEALYQLRSALDTCIYQASIYSSGKNPPPDENKLEFPICSARDEFPKLAKRRLFALPQNVQDRIEQMQPYNTPSLSSELMVLNVNRSLGILNDLARKDRHRTLHLFGSWVTDLQPDFDLPDGVKLTVLTRMMGGFLGDWSDVATFKLSGYSPNMAVRVNPHLTTLMALDEPPAPVHENDNWGQRITQLPASVEVVIEELEGYF
jgi:hypothetical protein